ncbi:MAG: flagellar FlbD family protein [Treponema sp.]|nr:flagellar FlbD family protein [Treponema sp.]
MISVTKLDGRKYWINPHMIESMEESPDLTITFLSGKKIVVKDNPSELINQIISYRQKIGIVSNQEL